MLLSLLLQLLGVIHCRATTLLGYSTFLYCCTILYIYALLVAASYCIALHLYALLVAAPSSTTVLLYTIAVGAFGSMNVPLGSMKSCVPSMFTQQL